MGYNISQSSELPDSPPYFILLDSVITVKKYYDDLIKAGRDNVSFSLSTNNAAALEVIPHFLCHNYKVTNDHKGSFQKGYIRYYTEFCFLFTFRRNTRDLKMDFTVPLPSFKKTGRS